MSVEEIVANQRKFFNTHKTKDINYRIEKLKKLKEKIKEYEPAICEALKHDLGKSSTESYMAEIGMVLEDLSYIIKHVKSWSKKQYKMSPIAQFPSTSFRIPEPYGLVLVMSPWNYPFLLTMQPVVGAICAGNCVVIKPSRYSVYTANIIKKIIEEVFEPEYATLITGGSDIQQALLNSNFDYIFYTGSARVGKIVMEAAAKNLTPVTLELGGKSPVIVDQNSDVDLAAKRVVFGKLLNAGQTCVAPDYVFVHKNVKNKFVESTKKWITQFLGERPLENDEYPKMANEKQFNRIAQLIDTCDILFGGKSDKEKSKIELTIVDNKDINSPVMQEEIFGPILPIIEYTNMDEVVKYINEHNKPLALYLFTNDKKVQKRFLKDVSFGGGCINDTIIHLATSKLGFGGVGYSGMGDYHGKYSFEAFSHYKSIVKKANWLDLPMRYHPYKKINDKIIKMVMK